MVVKMDNYRVESGSVYEYRTGQKAYIFIGSLNGGSFREFIRDIEDMEYFKNETN